MTTQTRLQLSEAEALAMAGLQYIVRSPQPEHGGFHAETVRTAKSALRYIRRLEREARKA